jgi:queuine/archaeosine tRNA-ribosyltransferase
MNDSSTAPRFRLLIHGQDGSIPYLTPELIRLMFFPEETDDHQLEDGKLHREHIILGLAVKDTCVTPDYQETLTTKKKRKGDNTAEEENDNAHLAKQVKLNDVSSADASIQNSSCDGKDSNSTSAQQQHQQSKKPKGYSFLNKHKSSRICGLLNNEAQGNSTAPNYLEKYLRTPHHLSTLIVPTFSFVNNDDNDMTANSSEEKKYTPKKQDAKQSEQKISSGSNNVIPKSTKDAVSIKTPHGWQSIQPEQYCEAVSSMTLPTKSTSVPSNCEGAVGIFDHVDLSSLQSDSLFSENSTVKNGGKEESETNTTKEQARKQALKKITMSVQKSNDWACRAQDIFLNEAQSIKLWLPVQILASQLPSHVLFTTPKIRPNLQKQFEDKEQKLLSNHSNVAIIGWDVLVCGSNQRRNVLRNVMDTLQSASTNPKQFLLLAVNDLQSMLDAAREGISIIGSDMARLRSRTGIALCFDFAADDSITWKEMDLKETRFARDFDPILSKCTCLACRPRKTGTAPSFTRAYIHHLIQAKEMLAEILLFTHNLHQLILLFRQLSNAAALDEGNEEKEHLETFCRKIEQSLA